MKSQVNALLHVLSGIITDVRMAYPELKESLSKDLDRLTLYCQTRGLALFTLDLPHLESLLLRGLEVGRLELEGPLSHRVSSKTQVPRLFSGLWLRVFDNNSCLKREVDVNAIFFLRQLLVVGKKIRQVCSHDRLQAKVGEYHDIERKLRKPSFDWDNDRFQLARIPGGDRPTDGSLHSRDCHLDGGDYFHPDYLPGIVPQEGAVPVENHDGDPGEVRRLSIDLERVQLAQALDYVYPDFPHGLPLFQDGYEVIDGKNRLNDALLLHKIQKVADLVFSSFATFDPVSYSASLEESGLGIGFKHGPGAVAERLRYHEKSCFRNWPLKLQNVFPYELCGKTSGSDEERPPNHEVASRLIDVPKTAKGPRLIAAEPTSHQWCQQLILRFLFNQCKENFGSHFIDFRNQSLSGGMVLKASYDQSLATVDLSDASDRLSCWTVERIVRKNPSLLKALHAARTRYIRDEISDVPSFLRLRKFASQGTATTFPIMSLVMLCIALGSTLSNADNVTWPNLRKLRTRVRIFGDDIIIPKYGYERLSRAMDLLQLKVNKAKSYVHGHFRESCGTDGYGGYDITPVKPQVIIADSPASCKAVIDTSNNLFNKGLWYAARAAEDLIPVQIRRNLRVVGRNDAGCSGLSSYSGSYESHLRSRWNSRLHRHEVRVWSIKDQVLRSERVGFDAALDFFARAHDPFNPRIVGTYVNRRKTIARLLWEPQISEPRLADQLKRDR